MASGAMKRDAMDEAMLAASRLASQCVRADVAKEGAVQAGADRRARLALARDRELTARITVGDENLEDVVTPTLERLLRDDVQMVDLAGNEGKGLVRALRATGLAYRLRRLGLTEDQQGAAVRFARDFDKARIGGLTANYQGGGGKGQSREPERWCDAMDLLSKASTGPLTCPITPDERAALFAYVILDVSLADIGAMITGTVSPDKNMHKFTGKLFLDKALNKMALFYEDWDYVQERHQTGYKSG